MVLLQITSRSAFHIGLFKGNDRCIDKSKQKCTKWLKGMQMLVYYRLHSCSFLSACFRETQVFNMDARSLPQTKWSFRPRIWAANWAAASGERTVEQPRPKRVRITKCFVLLHCTLSFKCLGPVRFNIIIII